MRLTLLFSLIVVALAAQAGTPQHAAMPPYLHAGDRVAIISPGSTPGQASIDSACQVLRAWGLRPEVGRYAAASYHLWAGTAAQREADLLWALRDPGIKAIMCTRGGYGSSQLLCDIPLDTLKRYGGKWIVGYSDITALHSAWARAGHMSIHGNMCGRLRATGGRDSLSQTLRRLLMGQERKLTYTVKGHPLNQSGHAQGVLLGGNLSVFVNISGSEDYDFLDRDFLKDKDVILFFEDVGENISRVSSMFTQLRVKGVLGRVKGVIVGHFTEYRPSAGYSDMYQMLHDFLQAYDIPVCYDFPTSHDEELNVPLIEGCPVTLDVSTSQVRLQFHQPR